MKIAWPRPPQPLASNSGWDPDLPASVAARHTFRLRHDQITHQIADLPAYGLEVLVSFCIHHHSGARVVMPVMPATGLVPIIDEYQRRSVQLGELIDGRLVRHGPRPRLLAGAALGAHHTGRLFTALAARDAALGAWQHDDEHLDQLGGCLQLASLVDAAELAQLVMPMIPRWEEGAAALAHALTHALGRATVAPAGR